MNESTGVCPVCGGVTTTDEYYTDGQSILEESYTECTQCSYQVDFSYGRHCVHVGTKSWLWSFGDSDDEKAKIKQEIADTIKALSTAQ